MPDKKILAFSSSKVGNGKYLQEALPVIEDFLGDAKITIAFIPFASAYSYSDYFNKVNDVLGKKYNLILVTPDNATEIISTADAIMVGGGNTFKLLHDLYFLNLIDLIKNHVNSGIPYIGWSAGSNITGNTISTSNDMAIIYPQSFDALKLMPFQINPHFTDKTIEGHNGETRSQRIEEYLKLNPDEYVVCLPEGTWLKYENKTLTYNGISEGVIFNSDKKANTVLKSPIIINDNLSWLLKQ